VGRAAVLGRAVLGRAVVVVRPPGVERFVVLGRLAVEGREVVFGRELEVVPCDWVDPRDGVLECAGALGLLSFLCCPIAKIETEIVNKRIANFSSAVSVLVMQFIAASWPI
jgi:hypothetical protein